AFRGTWPSGDFPCSSIGVILQTAPESNTWITGIAKQRDNNTSLFTLPLPHIHRVHCRKGVRDVFPSLVPEYCHTTDTYSFRTMALFPITKIPVFEFRKRPSRV